MTEQPLIGREIFVLDGDASVRDLLSAVLRSEGCHVACFADGRSFLAAARERAPACILLGVNASAQFGFDALRELDAPRYSAPILIVSGQRDMPAAVRAIKDGALDFIEKPLKALAVTARIRDAISVWASRAGHGEAHGDGIGGAERLTPREREVLAEIVAGASNKEAGRRFGISPRTVEVHRARIMEKLGARNAADLVRIALGQGARH